MEAKKLVNSYRFSSKSPQRKKVWTPELTKEEISKKKRLREDAYIKNFDPNDRPILIIKNKEEFSNKNQSMDKQKGDTYVKLTQNT